MKQIFKIFSYPSKPTLTFLVLGISILITAILANASLFIAWMLFPKIEQITAITLLLINGAILLTSNYILINQSISKQKYSLAQALIQSSMLVIVILIVLLFEFTFDYQ